MKQAVGTVLALAVMVALSAGCQGMGFAEARAFQDRPALAMGPEEAARAAKSLPPTGAPAPAAPAASPTRVEMPDWAVRAAEMAQERVIVYTAQYSVAVANPHAALADAEKLAGELGGYVQSVTENTITLRVPADKFKTAAGRIERMGQLVRRDLRAHDITEEYVDLRMRLASSQAMLVRLKALLEKAPDAKQALEVEREIARVMTEIERLQGRIRLLENQAALSTLTVCFQRLAEAPRPALLGRRLPFDWLHTLGINRLLDY